MSKLLEELDQLIETQARLQFAGTLYDEDQAYQYGVDVLDFIRKRGVELRGIVEKAGHVDD